jgi:uncharacterized protein YgbK (DUF1537 family)
MTPEQPSGHAAVPPISSWLFVCGSASQTLAGQVARLVQETGWPHLRIRASDLAATRTGNVLEHAQTLFEDGERQGLIISIEAMGDCRPTLDPEQVVSGLAEIGAKLAGAVHPDGLFLCGGDTAEALRRRVGATGLLLHEQPVEGLVRGEFVGGTYAGLSIVTKAGGFGNKETLVRLVNRCAP